MPPRRSVDLDVPPSREPEPPLPANVLDFFAPPRLGFIVSPIAVLEQLMQRQRKSATEKAIARHARRDRRRLTEAREQ